MLCHALVAIFHSSVMCSGGLMVGVSDYYSEGLGFESHCGFIFHSLETTSLFISTCCRLHQV